MIFLLFLFLHTSVHGCFPWMCGSEKVKEASVYTSPYLDDYLDGSLRDDEDVLSEGGAAGGGGVQDSIFVPSRDIHIDLVHLYIPDGLVDRIFIDRQIKDFKESVSLEKAACIQMSVLIGDQGQILKIVIPQDDQEEFLERMLFAVWQEDIAHQHALFLESLHEIYDTSVEDFLLNQREKHHGYFLLSERGKDIFNRFVEALGIEDRLVQKFLKDRKILLHPQHTRVEKLKSGRQFKAKQKAAEQKRKSHLSKSKDF
jgi:hypothetical protein